MMKNIQRGASRVVGLCGMLLCGGLTVVLRQYPICLKTVDFSGRDLRY
jgi:hypothetical protein